MDSSKTYDVLVASLHRSYRKSVTKWVRGVRAESLTQACRIAEARYPNLGLTPTTTSMAWPRWPQPGAMNLVAGR